MSMESQEDVLISSMLFLVLSGFLALLIAFESSDIYLYYSSSNLEILLTFNPLSPIKLSSFLFHLVRKKYFKWQEDKE